MALNRKNRNIIIIIIIILIGVFVYNILPKPTSIINPESVIFTSPTEIQTINVNETFTVTVVFSLATLPELDPVCTGYQIQLIKESEIRDLFKVLDVYITSSFTKSLYISITESGSYTLHAEMFIMETGGGGINYFNNMNLLVGVPISIDNETTIPITDVTTEEEQEEETTDQVGFFGAATGFEYSFFPIILPILTLIYKKRGNKDVKNL